MARQAPPPWSSFLAPRFWPTWTGIGLLCLIAWLPFRLRLAAGSLLGWGTWLLARERRYITTINIRLCFPELSPREQDALVRRSFIDNGIGLIETASGWVRPPTHFTERLVMRGTEHLDAALATGRGVLMLGAHYSTLDFGANLLSVHYPFAVTYRPHKNPLFDAFMLRGRLSNCNGVFDRYDIRGAFRHLRQNRILWYAPDQDYGPEQAVFVPWFGHAAATITAASRFAGFNRSPVVMVRQERRADGRYVLEFSALAALPTGDDHEDARLINQALERALRVAPAQYLWMHKRFKTQAGGKPASPYVHVKTPEKTLSESQYAGMLAEAPPVPDAGPLRPLASGLCVREFAGVPGRLGRRRHPAWRLDRLTKDLRGAGFATLTVDNLFRVPSRGLTAATCFVPAGAPLAAGHVAPAVAATFLAELHNRGFHFTDPAAAALVSDGERIAILEPFAVRAVPGSASFAARRNDLVRLGALLELTPDTTRAFRAAYLAAVRPADRAGFRAALADEPGLLDNAPTSSPAGPH